MKWSRCSSDQAHVTARIMFGQYRILHRYAVNRHCSDRLLHIATKFVKMLVFWPTTSQPLPSESAVTHHELDGAVTPKTLLTYLDMARTSKISRLNTTRGLAECGINYNLR
jgi:hypothetical protein